MTDHQQQNNKFFNEADFDISANIESALADISFSAIEIPGGGGGENSISGDIFDSQTMSKSKDFSAPHQFDKSFGASGKSFGSFAASKLDRSQPFERSFVSSVLDKAVMDNLDLTFTETLQKGRPVEKRSWSSSSRGARKTTTTSSSNDTILNDEIDKALKSIPEQLDFSGLNVARKQREIPPQPKPYGGILKAPPARVPSYHAPRKNTATDSSNDFNLGDLGPLKARLAMIRKSYEEPEVKPKPAEQKVDECLVKLQNLKKMIEDEIQNKRKQRLAIEANTEKIMALQKKMANYRI